MRALILILFFSFSIAATCQNKSNLIDTVFIKQSKSNNRPNYFCKLMYRSKGIEYQMYKTDDPEEDVRFYKTYKDSLNFFERYDIENEPDGSIKSLLFDRKAAILYITNDYNLSALNDVIMLNSVSFKNRNATVLSRDDSGKSIYYKIQLSPYWSINGLNHHWK